MRLISGMHRSGTSLTARLFYEVGAPLGDARTFHPADRWNPNGYFEQRDVHAINVPLVGGPWGRLSYFRLPSRATILRRGRRRAGQIQEVTRARAEQVVKECRFCLTLPAWLEQGLSCEGLLVCLREPREVARSLRRRNKIPERLGLSLWEEHNRRLLEAAEEARIPVRFLSYRAVLEPDRFAEEAGGALRFLGCGDRVEPARLEALRELCVGAPRSRRADPGSAAADYPAAVRGLWCELQERHAAQEES